MTLREHKLESGLTLRIQPASFAKAKQLFDAVSVEIKDQNMDATQEIDINFIKGVLLGLVSSPKVEAALWVCMENCLYKNERITVSTFEDMDARADYLEICYEVAKENVYPFMKNLYAKYKPMFQELGLSQK